MLFLSVVLFHRESGGTFKYLFIKLDYWNYTCTSSGLKEKEHKDLRLDSRGCRGVCERQNSIEVSCFSGKNALPPIPFFCNQNLRSPPALYHGLNSLDWQTSFFGEGQIWFHRSSGKQNSHLLPPHTAWEHQKSTGCIPRWYRFLEEAESPIDARDSAATIVQSETGSDP